MMLLTKELRAKLPKLYSQEKNPDPKVVVKFFTPTSNWTWYCTEGQEDGDDFTFFGLVHGFEEELGYFSLSELQSVNGQLGLGVERDLHWDSETKLSQVKSGERR